MTYITTRTTKTFAKRNMYALASLTALYFPLVNWESVFGSITDLVSRMHFAL